MSEQRFTTSGGRGQKPRISYSSVFGHDKWLARFNALKDLPAGTRLYAGKREFRLVHVWGNGDGHPARLELSEKLGNKAAGYQVRKGDALIFELQTAQPTVKS